MPFGLLASVCKAAQVRGAAPLPWRHRAAILGPPPPSPALPAGVPPCCAPERSRRGRDAGRRGGVGGRSRLSRSSGGSCSCSVTNEGWRRSVRPLRGLGGRALQALGWGGGRKPFCWAIPEVRGYVGEQVVLKCSFKSSFPITESLTIDWTYRPLTGGQMETVFHYQSVAYTPSVGRFKDRISWLGNTAKGDASIAIQSPSVSDNGTFICSVKNPPDVYHNIPQTVLIVTERGFSFQLTSVTLLSIVVFIPSTVVVVLMLVRMGRKSGLIKEKKKPGCKKSSVEESE
uniref:Myelin protein zero like 3 n=1 Tax=Meleagris gallopavo TaxID=9103 RepID=A0A803Y0B1_MELGA